MKISPCNLLKQQLGLLKIDEKGQQIEVYEEALDLDRDGTREEKIDKDGDKKISEDEVWSFFYFNINNLPADDVKKVLDSIALQVRVYKSAKHAELLGQLAFAKFEYVKEYKDLLITANQSDFPDLRIAAIGAMKMFLIAELTYYHDHPDKASEMTDYDLPPKMPANPDLCLERPVLPEGFIEATIIEVIDKRTGQTRKAITDGDTVKVEMDINGDGVLEMVILRFKGINTTEFGKGPNFESRKAKAEPGAVEAWQALSDLLAQANYKLYVKPERRDHYGRSVSELYVKTSSGSFMDVQAYLAAQGWGMTYFLQVVDEEAYLCYSMLQAEAQMAGKGLWGLKEFKDPRGDKKLKPLLITSFHPNAAREGGDDEPLKNEYIRIVNISDRPINLMDYRVYNKVSGKAITLPYFIVPPGRTVKIATGDTRTNSNPDDPEKDLVLSLAMDEPFWENRDEGGACLIIQDLDDVTIDSAARFGVQGCR